jgi:carbonic anhydrase
MSDQQNDKPDSPLGALLARNADWSKSITDGEPDFFPRLAKQQKPDFFWIGCADSRVPANVVAGLDPGEVFVHRNVANVVHSADVNMLSALEFAIDVLEIRDVIVCGHYGCGGVAVAVEEHPDHGLADHWLTPIRRLSQLHARELEAINNPEERLERLAELNVMDGVRRVAETPIMRRAWTRGEKISIHGLIYGLKDGRIRNLDCTVSGPDDLPPRTSA